MGKSENGFFYKKKKLINVLSCKKILCNAKKENHFMYA